MRTVIVCSVDPSRQNSFISLKNDWTGLFVLIERFRNIYDSDLNSKMKSKRSEDILNVFELTNIFGLVVHLHLSTNFW
jgi:hypothetical protein